MNLRMAGVQGERPGEQRAGPLGMAALRIHHREQMRGIEMFRGGNEDTFIGLASACEIALPMQ